jgi:phosphatidylinositol-3-phosphatase
VGAGPEQVTATAWTEDALFALLGELRSAGFPIGVGEYLEAQMAAAACHRDGLGDNPSRLRNYLAPVLCTNLEQQQAFYRIFDTWWVEHAGGSPEDLPPPPQPPPPLRESELGEVVRKTRPWKWWAAALGAAVVVAGLFWGPDLVALRRRKPDAGPAHSLTRVINLGQPASPITLEPKAPAGNNPVLKVRIFDLAGRPLPGTKVSTAYAGEISDENGELSFPLDPSMAPQVFTFTHAGYYSPQRYRAPLNAAGGTLQVHLAPLTRWGRLLEHQRKIQAGLALLPLAVAGPWLAWRVRRRRQLVLERRATREERATASISLPEPRHELYRGVSFSKAQVEMRRRLRAGSGDFDAEATVEATVRRVGFFTPVFRDRLETPLYLALIDRSGFRDQRAQMIDLLLDRLQAGGVDFERYDFERDPRRAVLRRSSEVYRDLEELAGLYPNHRLAVFADGAGFTNPVTGRLAPWVEKLLAAWPEKTLLTPVPVCDWGRRELDLAAAGFAVLPASAAGIERLADALHEEKGTVPRPLAAAWQPPYPDLLAARPGRFLERHAPAGRELDDLCTELSFYLGPDGYRWLRTLAVYPELDWYLTLYLGLLLKRHDGRPVLDEAILMALTRLPWLRHGAMPDWLRLRLVRDLSGDDEKTVREWLRQLLQYRETAGSPFRLDVARPPEPTLRGLRHRWRRWTESRDWRRLIKDLAHAEPPDGPLRDQVFVTFLLGKTPSKLQVRAPSAWQRLAWEQGLRALGPRTGSMAALTVLLSIFGFVLGGPDLAYIARETSQAQKSRVILEPRPASAPPVSPAAAPPHGSEIPVKPRPDRAPSANDFGPPKPPPGAPAGSSKTPPQETPAQTGFVEETPPSPPPTPVQEQPDASNAKAPVQYLFPVYDHVVIVVEANKNYEQIIGSNAAPYINRLKSEGANLTQMYAEEHHSQGNYFWLFSGSNQNVGFMDVIPRSPIKARNLGEQLISAGRSFKGYSEDLPAIGSMVERSEHYARKHVPWVSFANLPPGTNLRFSDFPADYNNLPTVSFVIPNLVHDMHDGSISTSVQTGDAWLRKNLDGYYQWAKTHNSLLIVTFDEDDHGKVGLTDPAAVDPAQRNRIVTILAGARIKPGNYSEGKGVTHVNLLRTLEIMYGLQKSGSQQRPALAAGIFEFFITDVFDAEQVPSRGAQSAAPKSSAAPPPSR